MSSTRPDRGGLGGLGALFFLGTLGAIAIYVQRQSEPDELELPRTSATAIPEVATPSAPPPLPWVDRLDLAAAKLVPYTRPGAAPPPDASAKPAEKKATVVDGRLVQDLNDGHRIMLTIDPVLQDAALQIFRNREVPYAAAVMLDVRDASVLVMAGHSSMDPQVDPLEIVATAWAPAASVFKLVTAAGLIDSGKATPSTRVCFNGGLHGITDDELRDDAARDTQCETLADAVAHSYNLVIGKLALAHLGQEELANIARKFLFETDIPFELNVERSPAHIPSDPIERAKVAAGFWNIDMSPIHGAVLADIFAQDGMYRPPHVIAQVIGPDGADLTPALPKSERVVSRELADAIGSMMESTTTEGTARASFRDGHGNDYIQGVPVAGKTGSLTGKRAPSLNYNWFIGYAPADRPEIAFAVLLANEPAWRIKAHYAARRLVQLYLERRDAIARARDAKLTPSGVVLPERDASGVLVSSAAALPPPPKPDAAKPSAGKPNDAAKTDAKPADPGKPVKPPKPDAAEPAPQPAVKPSDEPALPPPPGAEPLPPVPGPLPSAPAPGPMGG
ncbi:MAG TPA: penicillin-binding transpeptidase domain-containing protein [Nannocystaceae bacterium]|nr:penicillin-binding transpeptidase domain-containing protein [Nannocystaceae bacterium]